MSEGLDIAVRHRLGDFRLDATIRAESRLTALFGRSGSGKTTLVEIIAGLIRPDEGRVVIDGTVLCDTARNIAVPRHRRRIGYVFQDARLFPHLNVRQNLLFGRWFARRDPPDGAELSTVLDLLGIGHLLARRPANLSGGEKQRVAIGRALLARPRLLLMDEPLASLDEERKAEILPYIERLRDETATPIVYVSHSAAEVARLATTLVVLDHGRVLDSGPTAEVMARRALAGGSGVAETSSLLEARVTGPAGDGLTALDTAAGPLLVARAGLTPGARLRVRIAASDVLLSLAPLQDISALNLVAGTIRDLAPGASPESGVDVRIACGGAVVVARVTSRSAERLRLAPGLAIYAAIKSVSIDAS